MPKNLNMFLQKPINFQPLQGVSVGEVEAILLDLSVVEDINDIKWCLCNSDDVYGQAEWEMTDKLKL